MPASCVATVEQYLAEAADWRSTAEVAEAMGVSLSQARIRLEAAQIEGLCDCRLNRGVFLWRQARP